jgi:putative salt-induced outer membrane protein YdiY
MSIRFVCWISLSFFALQTIAETNVVKKSEMAEAAQLVAESEGGTSTNSTEVLKAAKALTNLEQNPEKEAKEVAETQQRIQEESSRPKLVLDPWEKFVPPMDEKNDWIQLDSGEWLKGDFKVLYNYELEFDSDELNLQKFDFEDVKFMRTRSMKTVFVENEDGSKEGAILRGLLEIDGDTVTIRRGEYEVKVPRSRVISIAEGREKKWNYWSGEISLGINMRGGNTKSTDLTMMANLLRRTAQSRFSADYLLNYSKSTDQETANNQRLTAYYDQFLSTQFFWKALEAEFYRDPFSNIDRQYSIFSGLGYELIRSSRTEWRFQAGLGYQEQQFVSVNLGESDRVQSAFFTSGTYFDYEISKSIDYLLDYSLRLLDEENGRYTHHFKTKLSFDLIGDLDLDVTLIWDYIQNPKADDNGELPKKSDYQMILSLSYDF